MSFKYFVLLPFHRLQLLNPQIMKLLQEFVGAAIHDDESNHYEIWKGYLYACLLLVTTMAATILNAKFTERMALLGMKMQTSLVSTIYR